LTALKGLGQTAILPVTDQLSAGHSADLLQHVLLALTCIQPPALNYGALCPLAVDASELARLGFSSFQKLHSG